jgi:endo-1,4-beta-xylanase
MNFKTLGILICLIFIPSQIFAATIQGTLTSSSEPQPAYAIIIALDIENDSYIADVLAEGDGSYTMEVPDDRDVIFIALSGSGEEMNGFDLHQYVVESHATHVTSETRTIDFVTEPAHELILAGTDAQGQMAGEDDYPNMFITDMNDRAHPLLRIGTDNSEYPHPVPSYNIRLGEAFKIHFQWKLPYAGNIMVVMDNGGAGYSSQTQSAQILNVNQEIALTAISRLQRDIDEADAPTAQAEDSMTQAQDAFDALNFDEAAGLAIVAAEELALAHAREGIEIYRKGDLTVRVLDGLGNPIPNAWVTIQQQRHDFRFGFFDMFNDADRSVWERAYSDGFNLFTAGFYWSSSESEDDIYNWEMLDHEVGILDMDEIGFEIKGHPLIWFYDLIMPSYTHPLTHEELRVEVTEHVDAMVSHYSDTIHVWDVINEAHGRPASGGMTREQITDITREAVDQVHNLDPDATTIVNAAFDFYGQSVLSERFEPDHEPYFALPTPKYFEDLLGESVDFDVIGQQLYNGGCVTLFYDLGIYDEPMSVPTFDLATLRRMFGRLSEAGLPIHLTEQAVSSEMAEECGDIGYWRSPWTENQQAEFLEAYYTLTFGTQAIQAVTWWDMTDESSFIKYGGLYDEDWQPKEAYHRLTGLIEQWTTEESGVTSSSGIAPFRAFGGQYVISAALDEHHAEKTFHVFEQTGNTIDLIFEDYLRPPDDDDSDDDLDDDNEPEESSSEDESGRAGGCGC